MPKLVIQLVLTLPQLWKRVKTKFPLSALREVCYLTVNGLHYMPRSGLITIVGTL
jgi:hypothetical protein